MVHDTRCGSQHFFSDGLGGVFSFGVFGHDVDLGFDSFRILLCTLPSVRPVRRIGGVLTHMGCASSGITKHMFRVALTALQNRIQISEDCNFPFLRPDCSESEGVVFPERSVLYCTVLTRELLCILGETGVPRFLKRTHMRRQINDRG